jgi:two-component system chemotaxis response regulator CheY
LKDLLHSAIAFAKFCDLNIEGKMDLSGKKILIADDSILARKQLSDLISANGSGAEFIMAANGEEAITKYREEKADIVFLDIVMPVKDGIEAVRGIRGIDENALIVIVSSVGTQGQLKAALSAGAKDFIQKPLTKEQVTHVLNAYLEGES